LPTTAGGVEGPSWGFAGGTGCCTIELLLLLMLVSSVTLHSAQPVYFAVMGFALNNFHIILVCLLLDWKKVFFCLGSFIFVRVGG
jgi:hypothetical protein